MLIYSLFDDFLQIELCIYPKSFSCYAAKIPSLIIGTIFIAVY
nr:MAG TPA: hypothetical protein [Bacteriophage sp.]